MEASDVVAQDADPTPEATTAPEEGTPASTEGLEPTEHAPELPETPGESTEPEAAGAAETPEVEAEQPEDGGSDEDQVQAGDENPKEETQPEPDPAEETPESEPEEPTEASEVEPVVEDEDRTDHHKLFDEVLRHMRLNPDPQRALAKKVAVFTSEIHELYAKTGRHGSPRQ